MNVAIVIAPLAALNSKRIGGPGGSRTPDLLNAMPSLDRPRESARVVFVFKADSGTGRMVRQSTQRFPG
jgi:hypothetical protein